MKEESHNILLGVINTKFKEFKEIHHKEYPDDSSDYSQKEIEYDTTKIHRIKQKEFEQEGYFMIICTQEMYEEIEIEIWKVYKTEKYYHVVEFSQNSNVYFLKQAPKNYNFHIYNYFDYDRDGDLDHELWRNSTEILGIKLPDTFEL